MHACYVKKSTMPELLPKGPYFRNMFIKGTPFGKFATLPLPPSETTGYFQLFLLGISYNN